jgi:hypothetical protein
VGHLRKWGEGHYFNYDGTNATEYDDDLLIRAFVTEGGIGVGEEPEMTPLKFALNQNIPNPFNSSTRIAFELPEAGQTSLKVFDLQGRLVSTIFEGKLSSGAHNYQFEGANLASGIYFYILKTEEGQLVRKLVLMK